MSSRDSSGDSASPTSAPVSSPPVTSSLTVSSTQAPSPTAVSPKPPATNQKTAPRLRRRRHHGRRRGRHRYAPLQGRRPPPLPSTLLLLLPSPVAAPRGARDPRPGDAFVSFCLLNFFNAPVPRCHGGPPVRIWVSHGLADRAVSSGFVAAGLTFLFSLPCARFAVAACENGVFTTTISCTAIAVELAANRSPFIFGSVIFEIHVMPPSALQRSKDLRDDLRACVPLMAHRAACSILARAPRSRTLPRLPLPFHPSRLTVAGPPRQSHSCLRRPRHPPRVGALTPR